MSENKRPRSPWRIGVTVTAIALPALYWIINLNAINTWFDGVLLLLRPVTMGLVIAYLVNPFFRLFERRAFHRLQPPGLRRALSRLCSYLVILLVVAIILLLILPTLIETVVSFISNYESHAIAAVGQVNNVIARINDLYESMTGGGELIEHINVSTVLENLSQMFHGKELLPLLSSINLNSIVSALGAAMGVLKDLIFGIFVSIYLLGTKEKRYAQVMKLRHALFGERVNAVITRACTIADRSFGAFIEGKLIDSLIIGFLTYVLFSLFGIPYPALIASILAIATLIPLIGIILGAMPSLLIILLVDPGSALIFLLIVMLIQILDNNVVAPKVLGGNIGISSLCVVIAISTMGYLCGWIGMLIAVPLFATVLALLDEWTVDRLQKRGYPSGIESYYANDSIVDPARNAQTTMDKMAQSFERRALLAKHREASGEPLSRQERFVLRLNAFLHRHRVITEISDEGQIRVLAEEAFRDAEHESEQFLKDREPTADATVETEERS